MKRRRLSVWNVGFMIVFRNGRRSRTTHELFEPFIILILRLRRRVAATDIALAGVASVWGKTPLAASALTFHQSPSATEQSPLTTGK